jgi:hypothetical protein
VFELEPLVRTRRKRAVREPNEGNINTGIGELREADSYFPSLSIIAFRRNPILCATKQARYRKCGSAALAA